MWSRQKIAKYHQKGPRPVVGQKPNGKSQIIMKKIFFWKIMRIASLLLAALLPAWQLQAHTVVWDWENPDGITPLNAMRFYPDEEYDYVDVVPSTGEPCTVVVNITSIFNPSLISAQVLLPNPANEVGIAVDVLREPTNNVSETAIINGEWHATGLPPGNSCDATTPNPFSVPITVYGKNSTPPFLATLSLDKKWIMFDAGYNCALKAAGSLSGPWWNVGTGHQFTLPVDMPAGFFIRERKLGAFVGGIITDNSGAPYSGLQVGLLYGGPRMTSDSLGKYSYEYRLPLGLNLISITNPIGASVNVEVMNTNTTNYIMANFKVAMAVAPPVTNACNCTPWCAIAFGSGYGGQTPVFYSGGANNPGSGTPDCGQPVVTVTPPSGPPITIKQGSNHDQNSGPNPAFGPWTVSCTVCGVTKTATITVP
jgi:hypothetical protein